MNLNEAAEIVRAFPHQPSTPETTLGAATAYRILCDTMLAELDPTPISEEWLRENGWSLQSKTWAFFSFKHFSIFYEQDFSKWIVDCEYSIEPDCRVAIKTLGELRTLLRLMGGGE